jgi:MFS family permease
MLLIGRFIIGIGIGIANVACATYVAETSIPIWVYLIAGIPTQRALLTASFNNSYWIGAMIAGGITFAMKDVANNWAWRIPSMVVSLLM